jgi:hypothetical protein
MSFGARDLLAWIPVLVSVIAILIAKRAATRSLRPVLVFVCEVRDEVWRVQNVGTGPALDVVVAEKGSGKKLTLNQAPVVIITGKAFFDVGHSLKDQRLNRRSHLPGYAAWEIHPVMKLDVL